MSKYVDFDAMWAEASPADDNRPKIKVYGEEISLPVALPARIMLRALRSTDEKPEEMKAGDFIKQTVGDLIALVGEEKVEAWIDKGMTSAQLISVFHHCVSLYTPDTEGDGDEGNAQTPKTGAKKPRSARSSKSGRS